MIAAPAVFTYDGPMSGPLRVLVVAADPLARAGLSSMLEAGDECLVVGRLEPREWLADQDVFEAEACVLDLGWSEEDDDPVIDSLLDSSVLPVVVLSDHVPEPSLAATASRGWLRRDSDAAQITGALRAAVQGLVVLDPTLTDERTLPASMTGDLAEELTAREREVLTLVAEGISNREIAQRLGITENTVKYHVNGVLRKLDAESRTEAAVRGARLGLVRF